MNARDVYKAWFPPASPWTRWGKGVLFAHLDERDDELEPSTFRIREAQVSPLVEREASYRVNARADDVAVVVDLPAVDIVVAAIQLAQLGFRPVPLFNAVPRLGSAVQSAVNLRPIVTALSTYAEELAELRLPPYAPPAFLLHAGRRGTRAPRAGWLDNRSICTRADFPSGNELQKHGVRHVVVLRSDASPPLASDLADVLLSLQDAGMTIHRAAPDLDTPTPVVVKRPWILVRAFRALHRATMTRSKEGAFGHVIPSGG